MSEVTKQAGLKLYWKCRREGLPMIRLVKRTTLGDLEYDLWYADYDLTDSAREKVEDLFHEINGRDLRPRIFSAGSTYGCLPKVKLALAREYLPKLVEILNDPANHKPIGGYP
jgi:hypothetical protein